MARPLPKLSTLALASPTGISASDRAITVLTAIDPKTRPQDLARPGHMFPLRARNGGCPRPRWPDGS